MDRALSWLGTVMKAVTATTVRVIIMITTTTAPKVATSTPHGAVASELPLTRIVVHGQSKSIIIYQLMISSLVSLDSLCIHYPVRLS
jgi:hypothetical protein